MTEQSHRIRLAVLDMAGTTVADDGLVERAFAAALADADADTPHAWSHIRDTMGQSKIEVFRELVGANGAERANTVFEQTYADLVDAGHTHPIPGAPEAITTLRDHGVAVALTTGFGRETQARLVSALGWESLVDLLLCPADAGRGRPYPDMILTALLRLGVDDVAAIAVAGDTSSDVLSGVRSGASVVAGVLTGAHDADALRGAGATHVLGSIAELPDLLLSAPVHR
ncbi:phosphonatase-like hydrolase [Pseudonocardia spinosispora]|uniref:phosphonatase-like hydrolase n=1 Tax=Pseudonocardia spinosispora TaxID=103441 RepID=UPI000426423D|nr:phosphonatase-like hydrolase [Pseudonocardia spinosispora]